MGFDVFVQRFADGEAREADAGLLSELLLPLVARRDEESGYALLRFSDGEAELLGIEDLADGFMLTHVSGSEAWDALVDLATRAELTILPVGCPAAVGDEALLAHLPEELAHDAVVVTSGAALLDVIRAS